MNKRTMVAMLAIYLYTGRKLEGEYASLPREIPCSSTVRRLWHCILYIEHVSNIAGIDYDWIKTVDRPAAGL